MKRRPGRLPSSAKAGGRLDLAGEFGVAYWKADGSRSPSDVWQFNVIPMFRWWTGGRFYIEAGIGATVFTSTRFANKSISTAFQFGDHVGLGFLVAPQPAFGHPLFSFLQRQYEET